MRTFLCLSLIILFAGCSIGYVKITPWVYPVADPQTLMDTWNQRNKAYSNFAKYRILQAFLAKAEAESNLESFYRSIGLWIGMKVEW